MRAKHAMFGGVLLLGTLVVASPAGAVDVTTEAQLRAAFADGAETEISLQGDVVLTDCAEGDLDRNSVTALTILGNGFTVEQTCAGERVMEQVGAGAITIEDLTVTGGSLAASSGGGIDTEGALTVVDSTITGNAALGGGSGGGLDVGDALTVTRSTISDNQAGDTGGGIRGSDPVTITDSTISGNSTEGDTGGGGGIDTTQGGLLTVVNSTVTMNSAPGQFGGGLASDEMVLRYATVVDNSSPLGANVALGDPATLESYGSVVAQPAGGGLNCESFTAVATTSLGGNQSDDTSCGFTDPTDDETMGDPLLGALADNGGPTATLLPLDGSPLLDFIAVADCDPALPTDQRGVTRPQGTGCDTGAVEVQANTPVPPTPPAPPSSPDAGPVAGRPAFTG
jgi:hypothetical protein